MNALQPSYRIQTPNGYVGRMSLTDQLSGDMPKGFAYCYGSLAEAQQIAEQFGGIIVDREWVPVAGQAAGLWNVSGSEA